jgi:hypothetical protein
MSEAIRYSHIPLCAAATVCGNGRGGDKHSIVAVLLIDTALVYNDDVARHEVADFNRFRV